MGDGSRLDPYKEALGHQGERAGRGRSSSSSSPWRVTRSGWREVYFCRGKDIQLSQPTICSSVVWRRYCDTEKHSSSSGAGSGWLCPDRASKAAQTEDGSPPGVELHGFLTCLIRCNLEGRTNEYPEKNREGDHICSMSDLRKTRSLDPDRGVPKTWDDPFEEIVWAWKRAAERVNASTAAPAAVGHHRRHLH